MFDDEEDTRPVKGKGNIGKLHDNKPKNDKERELAKKVLKFNLDVMKIGFEKPKTPEELQDRFTAYFTLCSNNGMPPTIEGLALCSGWCRTTFYDIGEGRQSVQFTNTIKKAKDYVCNYDAAMASIGKVNAPVYIFRAKNFYNMKDVQEIQAVPLQDATKPQNENEILNALPEAPEKSSTTLDIGDIGDFDKE